MRRGRTAAILLDHPAFTWLWAGLAISYMGDQFAVIALLWFVLELTGSGVAVGLVIVFFQLPAIVTGPLLGQLLDRFQPRLVMGLDNAARAILMATIPLLYWLNMLQLWQIYALALAAGALQPATMVGVRTYIPHLVPDHLLDQANALWSASAQFAALAGPVAAGYLVASAGGPAALLVDAASFVVMSIIAFGLPNVQRAESHPAEVSQRSLFGFGPLLRLHDVRALTALSVIFFFAYGPLEPALPIYSRDVLHAGAEGFGLLWSGYGAGALMGLFAVSAIAKRARPGVLLPTIAILWGLLLLPLVLLDNLYIAMFFFAVAGFAWAPYSVIEVTILQRLVPANIRGKVFGARATLTVSAPPLGSALGGLLLDHLSAPIVIGISSLGCIIAGFLGLRSPVLRRIEHATIEPDRRSADVQAGQSSS